MGTEKDDRIFTSTKLIAAAVAIVLCFAFYALYLHPDQTETNFAWTILPPSTAMMMGAGYTAGAFFFVRLILDKKWHHYQSGFPAITAFTVFMLLATLLHWSRFHQGQAVFYIWTAVYALTPLLVPFVWWRNQSTFSNAPDENDIIFPNWVRLSMRIFSAVIVLLYLFFFIQPSLLITLAPWKLTELTARIFCGWSILAFSTLWFLAQDGRWSSARALMESAMFGITLTLLALPRMWSDFDFTRPMSYLLIGALVISLPIFLVVHFWLDRPNRNKLLQAEKV